VGGGSGEVNIIQKCRPRHYPDPPRRGGWKPADQTNVRGGKKMQERPEKTREPIPEQMINVTKMCARELSGWKEQRGL